jgi:undecaprenyl phosphate-alpha-L-ara4N flippase subunit ArnE
MKATLLQWLGLAIIPLVVAAGQILFKMTAVANSGHGYVGLLTNTTFWIAIILYGAATVAWIPTIESFPISQAFMFMALTYIYVPAFSVIFLHEDLSARSVFGTALIIAGIIISISR